MEKTKRCPLCGEEILAVAIKCKHCGSILKREPDKTGETLGYLLLLIPLLSTILIWVWVGNMNLLQNPGSSLNLIGIGTLFLTAIIAYVEASQLKFGEQKKETKPAVYFFAMILLWIVVYPIYLYQRSKKGKKNLIVGGIILAIIFAGSYFLMHQAIAERIDEIRGILG